MSLITIRASYPSPELRDVLEQHGYSYVRYRTDKPLGELVVRMPFKHANRLHAIGAAIDMEISADTWSIQLGDDDVVKKEPE